MKPDSRFSHILKRAFLVVPHLISKSFPPTRGFALRAWAFRRAGLVVGQEVRIVGGACFHYSNVAIGKGSWIGTGTHFYSSERSWIYIGERVDIAPGCLLNTGSHEIGTPERRAGRNYAKSIRIGDGTWIGMGALILDGTEVGKGCVIAAGAVVRGVFPDDVLIAGVPARVARSL